jgi:hypothetical protein
MAEQPVTNAYNQTTRGIGRGYVPIDERSVVEMRALLNRFAGTSPPPVRLERERRSPTLPAPGESPVFIQEAST